MSLPAYVIEALDDADQLVPPYRPPGAKRAVTARCLLCGDPVRAHCSANPVVPWYWQHVRPDGPDVPYCWYRRRASLDKESAVTVPDPEWVAFWRELLGDSKTPVLRLADTPPKAERVAKLVAAGDNRAWLYKIDEPLWHRITVVEDRVYFADPVLVMDMHTTPLYWHVPQLGLIWHVRFESMQDGDRRAAVSTAVATVEAVWNEDQFVAHVHALRAAAKHAADEAAAHSAELRRHFAAVSTRLARERVDTGMYDAIEAPLRRRAVMSAANRIVYELLRDAPVTPTTVLDRWSDPDSFTDALAVLERCDQVRWAGGQLLPGRAALAALTPATPNHEENRP